MEQSIKFLLSIICAVALAGCIDGPKSKENAQRIKNVKVGMKLHQVVEIMGDPIVVRIFPYNVEEYEFKYDSPSGSSSDFYIAISRKDSIVLRVGDGQ